MEDRYAAFDGGSRGVSKWGSGSRLPENYVKKEAAGYAGNNRRMLNHLPVEDPYGRYEDEPHIHNYEPRNPMSVRRGIQGVYSQWEDPTRLLNVRSARAGDSRLEDLGERFRSFSVNPREPRYGPPASTSYGYDHNTSHRGAFRHNGVDNLERDRAELLRKLEALNHQINISKELEPQIPINRNRVPNDPYNAGFKHHNGAVPFDDPYDMEVQDIVRLHGKYRDPFGPHMAGASSEYARNPPIRPFPREQRDDYIDSESFQPYPRDPFPPRPPTSRMIPEDFEDLLQHHVSPARVSPSHGSTKYHSPDQTSSFERRSVDNDSEHFGGLTLGQPKQEAASNKSMKHLIPIAGGAPFVICPNCFDLLKLPRRLKMKENSTKKTRCGSCSAVINLKLEAKSLTVCAAESSPDKAKGPSEALNEGGNDRTSSHGLPHYEGMGSHEDTEHNMSLEKSEDSAFSRDEVISGQTDEIAGFDSSFRSSSSFEENVVVKEEESRSLVKRRAEHTSPNSPGSPLGNIPHSSSSVIAQETSPFNEKRSDCLIKKDALHQKIEPPHRSSRSDPEVTEVEISSSEYPITVLSQDSTDTSREEDNPKDKKGVAGSFFKGLLRRSVKDEPKPEPIMETEILRVAINGHPIPDDAVVRAEEFAGPILPGDYWYDYQSGFWGVMHNPCLGIIPPFIEEFNYPLPTNCSSGDTGIFVNGRQLHHHDLQLLASRGLPTTRNQFYTIDIFGKVIDEDTGEELYELGKLAPTVVKNGRGFGMRVPKGMM